MKNLALFGISNSVLIIDDDNVEISNLNRQAFFYEENKGLSKAKVSCDSAKEINNDLKCNYINKKNKDIFNKNYFSRVDFILGVIDLQEGNYYLMKQCELIEKILIKDGTKGASEKAEIFIPNMTCSFNDIKYIEEKEEKMPSCTRREFPGKIEDCIGNARDLFDEYFITSIADFMNLMLNENNNDQIKAEIECPMNRFNYFYKIICIIKLDNKNEIEFIQIALKKFYKLFIEDIRNIYKYHPLNDTDESKIFWNDKIIPTELKFDIKDDICNNFLFSFIKILADLLNLDIPLVKNITIFHQKLNEKLKDKKNINEITNKSIITNPEILYNKIISIKVELLNDRQLFRKIKKIKTINFEKNIPEFYHIQFFHSLANLKAKTY